MRVSTPVANDTAVLTTTSGIQSLNNHTSTLGNNFPTKNGMQQATRTITPTVQANNWSTANSNFPTHQMLVNNNPASGTTLAAYSKPSVATTLANVTVSKQLTTLTTVSNNNKVPQVVVPTATGVKQTVHLTATQPVRLPQQTHAQIVNPGMSIPQGMVLARGQNGQLFLVNSNSLTSSTATSTSTVLVTQSTASSAITTLRTSTPVAATQPITNPTITGPVVARTVVPVSNSVTVKAVPPKQNITLNNKVPSTSPAASITQRQSAAITLSEEDVMNVSKCRNFLTTLIQLASNGGQSTETISNVKKLVQNLIDDKIDPDNFTQRLQVELNSAPQPYLSPFLKKSLPLLRLTMMQQSRGTGGAPATVAVRPSSHSASTQPTGFQNNRMVLTMSKNNSIKNSVPDIRLPRVSPSPNSIQYSAGPRVTIRKPMPPPSAVPGRVGSQKFASPGGTAGGGGTFKDDDDINDVTSMAGVNLSEESDRILATNSELVGSQVRSCQDSVVVNSLALTQRLKEIVSKHPHVKQLHPDVIKFMAHAVETRVKDLIEKVSLVAFHRIANYKDNDHYEAAQDVKSQLKFLLELDVLEKKRHAQSEREVLMKAMKSRSKNDDPEQQRLKQKAKEMQQLEMERMQIREADETARQAIGPRKKKPKFDPSVVGAESRDLSSSFRSTPTRPRIKRVNLKDLVFVLEQEKDTNKSRLLYRSYLK